MDSLSKWIVSPISKEYGNNMQALIIALYGKFLLHDVLVWMYGRSGYARNLDIWIVSFTYKQYCNNELLLTLRTITYTIHWALYTIYHYIYYTLYIKFISLAQVVPGPV